MRRGTIAAFAALLLLGLSGCTRGPLNTGGVRLDGANVRGFAVAGSLDSIENSFTTKTFVVVGVQSTEPSADHNYSAYVAAPPTGSVSATVTYPGACLFFDCGWAYFCGAHPVAKTKRITAVGTSTRMIIEIDTTVDRVYLVPEWGNHQITLTFNDDPSKTAILSAQGKFVAVDENGNFSAPQDVTGDRLTFVENVKRSVWNAALPWPNFAGIPTWP